MGKLLDRNLHSDSALGLQFDLLVEGVTSGKRQALFRKGGAVRTAPGPTLIAPGHTNTPAGVIHFSGKVRSRDFTPKRRK